MKSNKKTHGGFRVGSGAKPKYKERTTTISFRVPLSSVEEIKGLVLSILSGYKND